MRLERSDDPVRSQWRASTLAPRKLSIIQRFGFESKILLLENQTFLIFLQNSVIYTAWEILFCNYIDLKLNIKSEFFLFNRESASLASTEIEAVPPSFIQHLSPAKEAMEGSRVRLDCILVGHPEPEVIWYKNDKPVKESKDIQLLFEGDRCTLCIREAYLEDSGTYRIVANNIHGQAESLCKLHVERK